MTVLTILRIKKINLELDAVTLTMTFQGHQYAEINYCPKGPLIPSGIFIIQYLGRGKRFWKKNLFKKRGKDNMLQFVCKINM